MKWKKDTEKCNIAGFENEGRGPEAKEYGQALEAGKAKKWVPL